MDEVFKSLTYENAAGARVLLSAPKMDQFWELGGRTGFTAPEVRLITEKYVNGNERIVNRIVQPRTVSINMIVRGKTSAIRDKVFFSMIDVLMDTSKGEIGKLYVTRSDGRTVILNCAYSSGLNVTEQYRRFQIFTLTFYASDPFFYTLPITQSVTFEGFRDLTLAEDLYLGAWRLGWGHMNGTALVENRTGGVAEPIYEIAGSRSSLKIRNLSRHEQISFKNMDMDSDERSLTIDTRSRYKSAYVTHADGSVSSALGWLEWSAISLSLPIPEGKSFVSIDSIGEDKPLNITFMTETLSA